MKYMMMLYVNEAAIEAANSAESSKIAPAYLAYSEAMQEAGILVAGERLHPTRTATRVRASNGQPEVLDGPYADSKEQIGGFYIIDVPDLDAALAWAARCPAANRGVIELRPLAHM